MLNYIRKKIQTIFNSDKQDITEQEQFYTPLRISLHSTIKLQTVDLTTYKRHPNSIRPSGDCEVLAIGTINTEDDLKLYQIYIKDEKDEEFILQLSETNDFRTGKPLISDIILFKQVVTYEPETEQELNDALDQIGLKQIDLDNEQFFRNWGNQETEKSDLHIYEEHIVTPTNTVEYVNSYMLYGRDIKSLDEQHSTTEYLLVGIEENNNNAQIMMQLGYKMYQVDIDIQ